MLLNSKLVAGLSKSVSSLAGKIILHLYLQNVMLPFFTWFKSSLFVVLDKVHVITGLAQS